MTEMYAYRARDSTGKPVSGYLSAADEKSAAAKLWEQDYYVIDLAKKKQKPGFQFLFLLERPGPRELASYCSQLSTMLGAGVPVINSLTVLESHLENKKLARVSGKLAHNLREGKTLYRSVKQYAVLPALFANIIKAGEKSGSLDVVLAHLALFYEKENEVKKNIISALIYPSFVFITTVAVVIVLLNFVLPTITGMLVHQDVDLPFITKLIISASEFLTCYWAPLLIFILVIFLSAAYFICTEKGKRTCDYVLINLPLLGSLAKKIFIFRLTRTLNILLQSGIPFLQALDIVKETINNTVFSAALERVKESVTGGQSIADSFARDTVIPPMVSCMIGIGESTGKLDVSLEKLAIYYEQDFDAAVSRLVRLLEPLLVLFTGGIVGLVIASVLLPLLEAAGI